MSVNLSIEFLRSFVAVVERGSIARATDRIFLSPSALSLQIKRLEETVQKPLFARDGKKLIITPDGMELLMHARAILEANDRAIAALSGQRVCDILRLGIVQDFVDGALPIILERFAQAHPDTRIDIHMAGSRDLLHAYQARRLDVVLCLSVHDDGHVIATRPVRWFGLPELAARPDLPLVLLPEPFTYRAMILHALERQGRRYRIAVESPNVDALRAALEAGVGVTARTADFLTAPAAARLAMAGLPALPDVHYVLHHGDGPPADFAAIAREIVGHDTPTNAPRHRRVA